MSSERFIYRTTVSFARNETEQALLGAVFLAAGGETTDQKTACGKKNHTKIPAQFDEDSRTAQFVKKQIPAQFDEDSRTVQCVKKPHYLSIYLSIRFLAPH